MLVIIQMRVLHFNNFSLSSLFIPNYVHDLNIIIHYNKIW